MRSYPATAAELAAWIYADARELEQFGPSKPRAAMLIRSIRENAARLMHGEVKRA